MASASHDHEHESADQRGVADLLDALAVRLGPEGARSLVICAVADNHPDVAAVREALCWLIELDDVALAAHTYTAQQFAPFLRGLCVDDKSRP